MFSDTDEGRKYKSPIPTLKRFKTPTPVEKKAKESTGTVVHMLVHITVLCVHVALYEKS